jgi:hypothetical protein
MQDLKPEKLSGRKDGISQKKKKKKERLLQRHK